MDTRTVAAAIRAELHPLLGAAGFTDFNTRCAWRPHPDRIDLVDCAALDAASAAALGCTTASFTINLGVWLRYVPDPMARAAAAADFRPRDHDCHVRGGLRRRLCQGRLARRDIWFVEATGARFSRCIAQARGALTRDAPRWFERCATPRAVLRMLCEDEEKLATAWGFGHRESPVRHYLTGYVARHVGERTLAREHLAAALASGVFADVEARLRADLD